MKKYLSLFIIIYSCNSFACKNRLFPGHLSKNEINSYFEIHEVWVQKIQKTDQSLAFTGKVMGELKGTLKSGQVFKADIENTIDINCPISLKLGHTYLLFMNKKRNIFYINNSSLYLYQGSSKYGTYIDDIKRLIGGKKKGYKLDPFIIPGERVGPITANLTEASFIKKFGKGNIFNMQIMGAEGDLLGGGAQLFNGEKEINITWGNDLKINVTRVHIRSSFWRTRENIKIGTSLVELEKLNKKPFKIHGFCWDYSGSVADWGGGRLQKLWSGKINIVFRAEDACSSEFIGSKTYFSNNTELRKLKPKISAMTVRL